MAKSQRLTGYLRDSIVKAMTAARFQALYAADKEVEKAAISEFTSQQVPSKILDLWRNGTDAEKSFINTSWDGIYLIDNNNKGGERVHVTVNEYYPDSRNNSTTSYIEVSSELYAKAVRCHKDREKADAEKRKLRGVLDRCTTVKQFLDIMPKAAKYVPNLDTPAREIVPAGEIVAIEELQRIEAEFLTRDFAIKEAE